jgi:hypothetical protein
MNKFWHGTRVSGGGAHWVDGALSLQRSQLGRSLERVRLLERQLSQGHHASFVYKALYTLK